MTMTDFGRQLGISKGQVSKLAAKGMPIDDLEAAKQWRRRNLDPSWAKPDRAAQAMPGADDPVGTILRRCIPAMMFRPEVIAGVLADSGIEIDGNGALRLAESFIGAFMLVVDEALGDEGNYYVPDYLSDVTGTDHAAAIAYLDKLLHMYRLLDKDDRLINACSFEVRK